MSSKKFALLVSLLLVLVLALAGCTGAANTGGDGSGGGGGDGSGGGGGDGSGSGGGTTGDTGAAGLSITGMVDNEMSWTEEEVRAMETTEAVRENNAGEEETYTGVSLNALLDQAGVQDGASTVVLVADDGYEVEVPLADLRACTDCIASFRNQGGFSSVMPGFPGNTQVKGLVELRLQ